MDSLRAIRVLLLLGTYFVVLGTVLSVVHHIARHQLAANNKHEKQHQRKTPKESRMTKRIIAITFIFLCTSVAWLILGATVFSRTYNSGNESHNRVESTWGAAQNQAPPTAAYSLFETKDEETVENGKKT